MTSQPVISQVLSDRVPNLPQARLTHCSHFCPTAFRLVPFIPLGKEAHARRPQHRHRIFLPVRILIVQSNPTLHRTRNLWWQYFIGIDDVNRIIVWYSSSYSLLVVVREERTVVMCCMRSIIFEGASKIPESLFIQITHNLNILLISLNCRQQIVTSTYHHLCCTSN